MSFKRFQVMDIFFPIPQGQMHIHEWIDCDKKLPEKTGMYALKLDSGEELLAYFCEDKCLDLMNKTVLYETYGSSYWWSRNGHEMIPQTWAKQWAELKKDNEKNWNITDRIREAKERRDKGEGPWQTELSGNSGELK